MSTRYAAITVLLLALALVVSCEVAGPPPPPAPTARQAPPTVPPVATAVPPTATVVPPTATATALPPLTGSGGGVFAYCYQPQSGLHQIYTINADGSGNRKLIDARIGLNHHDWSPDALKIAAVGYVDDATWSIHVFNADGSGLTRLTDTAGVWDSEPAWSPDGTRLAFTRMYPDQNDRNEIWVMDADGSDPQWIGVEGFAAKWSPDGARFIYVSNRSGNYEIYTARIDGTDERRLTDTSANEMFPTWSPDGTRIAFSASTGEFNTIENTKTYEIFVMNADGTGVQQLTNNDVCDEYPRWSPNGRLIAFGSDRSASQHWEIYVMNVDGTDVRRVTNTPSNATAINAVWRPATAAPAVAFEKSAQAFPSVPTYQIGLGDLDGDGDLDAVFANSQSNPCQVWLNDGTGQFVDTGQRLTLQGHGVSLGDLDGDGDLDALITCHEEERPSRVYLNDGHAVFQDSGQRFGDAQLSGNGTDLVDVDADGDLDAVILYYEQGNRVYLNDGSAQFTKSEHAFPAISVWGDLDGDGDVDVFFKEEGVGLKALLNDGAGAFSPHWAYTDTTIMVFGGIALGDTDHDGDLDAIVTNGDYRATADPTRIFLNDGSGRFADSGQQLGTVRNADVALGDLDGDGDVDLVSTDFQKPNQVWLNDGAGRYVDSGFRFGSGQFYRHVHLGDLDGDGDLDIFLAVFGSGGPNEVWFNQR